MFIKLKEKDQTDLPGQMISATMLYVAVVNLGALIKMGNRYALIAMLVTIFGTSTLSSGSIPDDCPIIKDNDRRLYIGTTDTHCLVYHDQPTSKTFAAALCPNGQLLEIKSHMEQDHLVSAIANRYYNDVWLGLTKVNGQWTWDSDGEILRWNIFRTIRGFLFSFTQNNCAVLSLPLGVWRAVQCDGSHSFICQYDKIPTMSTSVTSIVFTSSSQIPTLSSDSIEQTTGLEIPPSAPTDKSTNIWTQQSTPVLAPTPSAPQMSPTATTPSIITVISTTSTLTSTHPSIHSTSSNLPSSHTSTHPSAHSTSSNLPSSHTSTHPSTHRTTTSIPPSYPASVHTSTPRLTPITLNKPLLAPTTSTTATSTIPIIKPTPPSLPTLTSTALSKSPRSPVPWPLSTPTHPLTAKAVSKTPSTMMGQLTSVPTGLQMSSTDIKIITPETVITLNYENDHGNTQMNHSDKLQEKTTLKSEKITTPSLSQQRQMLDKTSQGSFLMTAISQSERTVAIDESSINSISKRLVTLSAFFDNSSKSTIPNSRPLQNNTSDNKPVGPTEHFTISNDVNNAKEHVTTRNDINDIESSSISVVLKLSNRKELNNNFQIIIAMAVGWGGVLGIILTLVTVYICRRRRQHSPEVKMSITLAPSTVENKMYGQLQRETTNV